MKTLNPNKNGSKRHDDLAHLDGESGVYVLYKRPNSYIGSTKDLRSRLRGHTKRFPGWYSVYQRMPIGKARERERELIQKFIESGFNILNQVIYSHGDRHSSVSPQTLKARLKAGWSLDAAKKTPARRYR